MARLHLLAAVLLLTRCGSQQDLVLGVVALSEAGTTSGNAGTAGDAMGGAPTVAGAGGSVDAAGGASAAAGDAAGGAAGEAGAGGADSEPPDDCVMGDQPPLGSLIHRYSFDGSGTAAIDSVGGAGFNGSLKGGAKLDGAGMLKLDSGSDFVDLPNGIVHSLTDLTVVVWTTWQDSPAWQRVFDFGDSFGGENQRNGGKSYFCMMTATGFDNQNKPGLGAEMLTPGFPRVTLASTEDVRDLTVQVAFSFKGGVRASLYLGGNRLATQATTIKPSDIDDVNNCIGQSQYDANTNYRGTFDEFRIYNLALNSCQLKTLLSRGPERPDAP